MRPLILLALTIPAAACLGSALPTEQREFEQGDALIPLERFRSDSHPYAAYSGLAEAERRIVTSEEEMEALWSQIHAGQASVPPLPSVDFGEEMVLVAALGGKPSSGYAIRIDSVAARGEGLEVFLRQSRPAPDCAVLAVITAPVDLVRLPRRVGDVSYREAVEVRECS
ncbi:MAG TPA: protease complex subunit PrcB family protein [Gemmatimonadales bacterium]|nr:protease complex subunit PrcB family protein [Gemmatimonadales bacterium]